MRDGRDTTRSFSDPEDIRVDRKRLASRIWRDAVRATGLSDAAVGAELGISKSLVRKFGDSDERSMPPLADVVGLPLEGRLALARAIIAEDGYDVVKLPESSNLSCGLALAADAVQQHAEALACLMRRVGRYMDAAQGAELEREGREAVAPLLTMIEIGRQAQRERVIQVPCAVSPHAPGDIADVWRTA